MDDVSQSMKLRRAVVLFLTLAVTAVFLGMIRGFLIALFLAIVFSSLLAPLYRFFLTRLRGYRNLAALTTLTLVVLVIVIPLLTLLGLVAAQAYQLSDQAADWVQAELQQLDDQPMTLPEWVPLRDRLDLRGDQILSKAGALASRAGSFLVQSLKAATEGTAAFFLNLFVMLYGMFYFLKEGESVQQSLMRNLPLAAADKQRLFERAVSVVRATVKGTMVIGFIQGLLGGIALAVAGIQGAAFWGTLMAVFSVVPGIGTAIVWVPAVLYLLVTGQTVSGLLLAAWCAGVVGSVDNLLRPALVGGDTRMPDLPDPGQHLWRSVGVRCRRADRRTCDRGHLRDDVGCLWADLCSRGPSGRRRRGVATGRPVRRVLRVVPSAPTAGTRSAAERIGRDECAASRVVQRDRRPG